MTMFFQEETVTMIMFFLTYSEQIIFTEEEKNTVSQHERVYAYLDYILRPI